MKDLKRKEQVKKTANSVEQILAQGSSDSLTETDPYRVNLKKGMTLILHYM